MEDDEVVDSGILSCSELEDLEELKSELEDKKQKIEDLQDELEDLQDELDDVNREYDDLEFRYNKICVEYDPETVKSDVIDDILLRLNRDNIMTPELEEWFDNYCRFYLGSV